MAVIYGSTSSASWTFRIDVYNINNYNINDNSSTMRVDVWLGRASTASNSYVGGNWSGHISIDWETPNQYTAPISGTIPYPTTMNAGSWYHLITKDFQVKHNDDGKRSIRVVSELTSTEFTPSRAVADGVVELVTIPRATDVPTVGTLTIEGLSYLQLNPKISTATHSVKMLFGNLQNWIQADGTFGTNEVRISGKTIPMSIPKEYYSQFSGPSGEGTLYLYTYNDNKKVGEKNSKVKIVPNASLCTPIIDATVEDTNPITLALTKDKNVIVANASNVLITPTIQVSDSDDTTAYVTSKSIDSTVFTTDVVYMNEPTTKDFLLSVSNSRGFPSKKTVSASGDLIPYTKLTFNIDALYRPETTGSEIVLKYSGRFYSGNFADNVPNELTLTWEYKTGNTEYVDGGVLTPTINTEDNTYSGEVTLGDIFDYQNQYDFRFFYKDKIIGTDDTLFIPDTVTRGIPVYWWTKDSFRIQGDLYVKDKLIDFDDITGNVHSTDEEVIGTWMGKPLYRRVLLGTLPDLTGGWQSLEYLDSTAVIRKAYGSLGYLPFPVWLSNDYYLAMQLFGDGYINVLGKGFNGNQYNITVEYTKTTD